MQPPVQPVRRSPGDRRALHRACLAGAALAGISLMQLALESTQLGPLARHMASHIMLMNVAAPTFVLALLLSGARLRPSPSTGSPAVASVAQLAALGAAHLPGALALAVASPAAHALMQAALFAAAIWFWLAVLCERGNGRWRALLALLMTGKIACLFGAVLVFAPRLLYSGHAAAHSHGDAAALSDQQLAGLLMIAACPLSYVLAGVLIAARWLRELAAKNGVPARSVQLT